VSNLSWVVGGSPRRYRKSDQARRMALRTALADSGSNSAGGAPQPINVQPDVVWTRTTRTALHEAEIT